jgi:hypothetical protein
VLAGMDYNKRQSWAYSHFRHQLAVYGLPLDDNDDSWRLPGRTISRQFGKDARKDLFGPAGGPGTQAEEIDGLAAQFKKLVSDAPDINAKRTELAAHLLPELGRAEDRDQTIHDLQTVNDEGGVEKLVARFDALATAAKNPQADRESRRRSIADFLYNFEYSPAWHARVQNVVGLDQYVAAAERQTTRMRDMIARNRRVIADEQTAFVAQYQAIPPELNDLAGKLASLDTKLTEQKSLVQRHEADRNARMTEAMNLNNQLAAEKAAAAKETAALAALQQELFTVQREWAEAQARNQQLQTQLRAKETGK